VRIGQDTLAAVTMTFRRESARVTCMCTGFATRAVKALWPLFPHGAAVRGQTMQLFGAISMADRATS
jgi:hypothetical protein